MAARTRFFRARSLILSPSNKSIARHALPPRPALKSLSGSGRLAPWEKVSLTLSLWALPTAIIPSRDHTGLPIHFHSSIISRSASRMLLRMLANVWPRQSVSSAISAGIYRRDCGQHQYGAAERPGRARRQIDRPRSAWRMDDDHLRGRLALQQNDRPYGAQGSHERRDVPGLCRAVLGSHAQAKRHRRGRQLCAPQGARHPRGDRESGGDTALSAEVLA